MKKKLVVMVLASVFALSMIAGCGSETKSPSDVTTDSGVSADAEETEETGTEETTDDASSAGTTDVTLDETVIYDNGGITVTVTGIENDLIETDIPVTVTNTTDQNILVTVKDLSVNDYVMSTAGLYAEVAAGKSANENIYIYDSSLSEAGIDTVANIEFSLDISNGDTWETIATSDVITLTTSAGADYVQAVDDSGDVMYDSNGIRVICKGLKDDLIWDGYVVFYMENNSDTPVSVYAENVSVNGYMEDVSLWSDMLPGKRSIEGMSIWDLSDLGIESIDEIQNIEFSLRIVNKDTWEEIATTDAMTLNFE